MDMEVVITEQKWNLDSVKDYISKFNTKKELMQSPEYGSIYSFYHRNNDLETLQDLTSGLEGVQKDWNYDTVKNYISQFNEFTEFRDSPYYRAIHTSIYKNYGPETWAELTSGLKKERESWSLEKVVEYVSQFKTYEDFKKSPKWNAVKKYIDRSYPGKWTEITSNLKQARMDWDLDKMKEYVSQFDTMYDFENSPMFKSINSFIYRRPNAPEIWADVTSNLKRKIFKGERKVFDILTGLGYEVTPEKKFSDCKSGKETYRCTRLKFDFYTKDKEGKDICVEFDGKQHFEPYERFGGEKRFQEQVNNDIIKKQYTEDNNIKLIRISYNDYKNIENELKNGLNSQNQLFLSSNYPKLGWNDSSNLTEQKLKKEYIITESQLKAIVENKSAFIEKLKRRFNKKTMQDFIYHAETEFPKPCEKFDNEFEYADAVINKAIDDFIFQEELEPYVYSGDWNFHEQIGLITMVCKEWFEDGLLGYHQTTCQDEFDDEDFDMMNEAVNTDLEPNKVIVKLFKILNTQKSNYNNKRDLQSAIKDYLPYFGIDPDFAPYILELYLLNYRQDGDYSSLTKDNFIDPRKMKGTRTPNYNAKVYTKAQLPFEGSNLRGYWRTTMDGKIYIVESYGWYPVYIFKDGKWYEASDRYSSSTGKQMNASRPYRWNDTLESQVYLLSRQEMEMIERGATHEKVMELKRKAFRDMAPSLISQKVSTAKSSSYGVEPKISIKFKISSVEEIDDKNVVNVDIEDVLKMVNGKQVPTPENYFKGEIPNVTPEKVEKQIETKLRNNFQDYLGPKFSDKPEEENIVFRFNHLKS
jgi:hypothetical protein